MTSFRRVRETPLLFFLDFFLGKVYWYKIMIIL